jgi:hypothetical protein
MTAAKFIAREGRTVFVLSIPATRLEKAPRIPFKQALPPEEVDWAVAADAFFGVASPKKQ